MRFGSIGMLLAAAAVACIGVGRVLAQRGVSAEPEAAFKEVSVKSAAPFAVVELFTSEGCSSCPPADEVVAEMVADARKAGARVMPLSFHVDYWNQLGWKDRFSSAAYSARQSDYARAFHTTQVYTPQMIVNGKEPFVGSEKTTAKKAIDAAMAKQATVSVSLKLAVKADGSQHLQYAVTGARKGAVVNAAVVERGLSTKVAAGENGGRILAHENVVRWFKVATATADGNDAIEVPRLKDVNYKNASMVVYVQEAGNGAIVGAARVDFPE